MFGKLTILAVLFGALLPLEAQITPSSKIADTIEKNISAAVADTQTGTLEAYWDVRLTDESGRATVHKRLTSCKAILSENWVFTSVRCLQFKNAYTSRLLEKVIFKPVDGKPFELTKNHQQLSAFYEAFARQPDADFSQIKLGRLNTEWKSFPPNKKGPDMVKTFDSAILADRKIYTDSLTFQSAADQKWEITQASFAIDEGPVSFPVQFNYTRAANGWVMLTPATK